MAIFIGAGAIFDLVKTQAVIELFVEDLGYPDYFPRFVGALKLLGVLVIVGWRRGRLVEWAYAGLTFDVVGALYSHLAVGSPISGWGPAVLGLTLVLGSYALFSTRHTTTPTTRTVPNDLGVRSQVHTADQGVVP